MNAALQRQNRHLERLKSQGVTRSTILVHADCKSALEGLRDHLIDPSKADVLSDLVRQIKEKNAPTNVAQVRHLSPFRYPGGKTWLVPEISKWLRSSTFKPSVFVEPFAGGGMASLTAAAEDLSQSVYMSELDEDVAAVWSTILHGSEEDVKWLCKKIRSFEVTLENVHDVLASNVRLEKGKAFRTIIKNRMQRGGILAAGAGLVKSGENGRGLHSRWYPETLAKRIETLQEFRSKITFEHRDAFEIIDKFKNDKKAFFFVDPPYTAGGKKAGSRLYNYSAVDHEKLFEDIANVKGSAMLTYDDSYEVRELAAQHEFRVEQIPMKNTHNVVMRELLILKP